MRIMGAMSVFLDSELRYLAGGRQLGRIATVGADGTPHVVPVAWIYNAVRDTIDVGGHDLADTKKFFEAIKVTLLASLHGYAPQLAVEFGRKVLYSTERPSFRELDTHVREVKAR